MFEEVSDGVAVWHPEAGIGHEVYIKERRRATTGDLTIFATQLAINDRSGDTATESGSDTVD